MYFHKFWNFGCDADGNYEKSFSSVFEPIERLLVPLNFTWRVAKNLCVVNNSAHYSKAFDRVSVLDKSLSKCSLQLSFPCAQEIIIVHLYNTLSFSLHFNGHFPGKPGLAGVY